MDLFVLLLSKSTVSITVFKKIGRDEIETDRAVFLMNLKDQKGEVVITGKFSSYRRVATSQRPN